MIAKARRLHRRWMMDWGICLIACLMAFGYIGVLANSLSERLTGESVMSLQTIAGLVACVALLAIGLIIGQIMLARGYNPNDQDVEIRKQAGRSRAEPLGPQEG
jgi:hypothetical protein